MHRIPSGHQDVLNARHCDYCKRTANVLVLKASEHDQPRYVCALCLLEGLRLVLGGHFKRRIRDKYADDTPRRTQGD